MSWGNKVQIMSNVSVDDTTDTDAQYLDNVSSKVTLLPGESATVQLVAAFPATTTNDLGFRIVTTLDDTTEVYDDIAFVSGSIGRAASTTFEKSIVVSGCYAFRLECRKLGTAAETITVNAYVRKNGISA